MGTNVLIVNSLIFQLGTICHIQLINIIIILLLLPGKGRNSINECLCPVIKNFAGPREQTSLLCYNVYN